MIWRKKMQHRIVKFKYAEYTGIRKKHAHDQQKSTCSKTMTEYAEKMRYRHPPFQEHFVYSHLICT